MNLGQGVSYRSPTRMQLRDQKFQRKDLARKYSEALDDIRMLRLIAAKENSADPLEVVSAIKEKADHIFTEVPENFKPKGKDHKDPYASAESRLKPILNANEEWVSSLKARPSHPAPTHEAVVSTKAPLRLTWDAQRDLEGKSPSDEHKERAQSQYAALFADKKSIEDKKGDAAPTDAGAAAQLYTPPEDNPRKRVEQKRDERNKQYIAIDKTRKAKILEVKPLPPPPKVGKEFVPGCAAFDATKGKERRQEIDAQITAEKKKLVGKAFR